MNANYLNPLWLKFHHHVSSINWITLLVYDILGQLSYFTWLRSLWCPYVSNEVLTSYVKTHVLSAKFNGKAVKFWKLLLNPQRRQGYSVQSANTSEVRLNYERKFKVCFISLVLTHFHNSIRIPLRSKVHGMLSRRGSTKGRMKGTPMKLSNLHPPWCFLWLGTLTVSYLDPGLRLCFKQLS